MQFLSKPIVSLPGEGTRVLAFGDNVIRMTAEQTAGRLGMLEVTIPPGAGAPLHQHEREDEFFNVLEGKVSFWCGSEHVELGEGGCILLPRGVPHRFSNIRSDPAKVMVIVTPGGFEGFFAAASAPGRDTPEAVAELAASYGLTFLD